ncbi:4'-phosphopantetheinyl transferase superfamily protein [Candidatus Phytoplasma meliae]|uniref:Holo-[acyl-carrier-protein] synthase n=2 Tax=Candidatus Phytoplasma meliae TaxID=1848402 RepID=A0ABS5CXM9_9MOLU|nr:4'-phosphopantetheinyl transferase superfamily protein [Candidatus Phytoplasma meliae]
MNVPNIGIDLVEINKIKKIGIQILAPRILSLSENQIYLTFKNSQRQLDFLAGRWAAKEALFKAFKTTKNLNFVNPHYREWSILTDQNGAPYLANPNPKHQVLLSITHTSNYALALAMVYENLLSKEQT